MNVHNLIVYFILCICIVFYYILA